MPTVSESNVGYSQLDDKGRLPLGKAVRQALGLSAGSTVAYVKIGEALMLIPQDAHFTTMMDAAMRVLEGAHIAVEDILAVLPEARDESVRAHYGQDFMDELGNVDARSLPAPTTH